MKKFLSILFLAAIAFSAQAQNTSPRYVVYGANGASSISFGQNIVKDTAGTTIDTLQLRPRYWCTNVNVTVVDSAVLQLKSVAGCYYNDRAYVYVTNPANTGVLKLNGAWVVSTGTNTISLTANKHCTLEFWFDGTNWVETSRNLNY